MFNQYSCTQYFITYYYRAWFAVQIRGNAVRWTCNRIVLSRYRLRTTPQYGHSPCWQHTCSTAGGQRGGQAWYSLCTIAEGGASVSSMQVIASFNGHPRVSCLAHRCVIGTRLQQPTHEGLCISMYNRWVGDGGHDDGYYLRCAI